MCLTAIDASVLDVGDTNIGPGTPWKPSATVRSTSSHSSPSAALLTLEMWLMIIVVPVSVSNPKVQVSIIMRVVN